MRIAALMMLMPLVCLAQRQMEISGKLELSEDHFVLVLKNPISIEQHGDVVSSRRVQVAGITVSQYETLSNQIGHTVDLSGEVHHAYHEDHKEKLVIDPDSISEGSGNDADNLGWWYKFWYSLTTLKPAPPPPFEDEWIREKDLIGTWQGPGADATGTIRVDRDKWSMTFGQNGRAEILRGYTYARPTYEDWNSIMNDGDMLRALGYRLADALNSWFDDLLSSWGADALSGRDATQRIKATWSLEKGTEPPDKCVMCHANDENNIFKRSEGKDYCVFIRLEKNGRVMFRWHLEKLTSNSLIVNTSNPHYYISLKKIE